MKQCKSSLIKKLKKFLVMKVAVVWPSILLSLLTTDGYSQTADGNAGINRAVKVYQKWNHGDHDTGKVAAAWFGSCIFLVIVATVLKSFFGL